MTDHESLGIVRNRLEREEGASTLRRFALLGGLDVAGDGKGAAFVSARHAHTDVSISFVDVGPNRAGTVVNLVQRMSRILKSTLQIGFRHVEYGVALEEKSAGRGDCTFGRISSANASRRLSC